MQDRRHFLKAGGTLLVSGLVAGFAAGTRAEAEPAHAEAGKVQDTFPVPATQTGVCATCQYWGGIRRVSEDRSTVHCESLGWCNNPQSHNYQSKTTPITGPMAHWKKWDPL